MNQPARVEEYSTDHMTLWLEPPDLVFVRASGHIEEKDMLDLGDRMRAHIGDWPYVLLIVDQTAQTGISADARRTAATAFAWVPYRGTAFCGGSFTVRTVGQMVMSIINAFRGDDNPTKFFKTEAEARSWLDDRRRILAKSSK